MGGRLATLVALSLAVSWLAPASAAAEEPRQFKDAAPEPRAKKAPQPATVRSKYVSVDRRSIADDVEAERVALELFDGEVEVFTTAQLRESRPLVSGPDDTLVPGPFVVSWVGQQIVDGGVMAWATLSLTSDDGKVFDVTGSVAAKGREYAIDPEDGDTHRVSQVDPQKLNDPGDGYAGESGPEPSRPVTDSPPPQAASAPQPPGGYSAQAGPVIDVVVGYANGTGSPVGQIVNEMSKTTAAFANSSSMAQEVRLVAALQTNYTMTGDYGVDLNALRDGAGPLATLRATRTALGADVIGLLLPANGTYLGQPVSGLADVPPAGGNSSAAFFVASQQDLGHHAFVHEVGHVLGGNHDPNNASPTAPPYAYSRGHYVNGVASDVMAYDNAANCPSGCARQLQFSDPNTYFVNAPGYLSGISNQRENRNSLLNLAPFVSGYANAVASEPTAAYQSPAGTLFRYKASSGAVNLSSAVQVGTSPAIAGLASGGSVVAFQGTNGNLVVKTPATTTDTGLGMAGGTSPSVAANSTGGFQVAFQANTGNLWTYDAAAPSGDQGQGMKASTSPSITSLSTGGYQMAFQANTTAMIVWGSAGNINTGLGMAANSGPSIGGSPAGGYRVAFQANTGSLWTYSSPGGATNNTGLGMRASTSPSIAALSPSGYQTTFQANTAVLVFYGDALTWISTLGMSSGTSPSTARAASGFSAAFRANTGTLWGYLSSTGNATNTGNSIRSGTSPSLAFAT